MALRKAYERLGFTYSDRVTAPRDFVLMAICGRPDEDGGETIEGLGLGACVFSPSEVADLAKALGRLDETWLRNRYDIEEFVALNLPGDGESSEFDEFYLPTLKRLTALYDRAAEQNQHLVVVMS